MKGKYFYLCAALFALNSCTNEIIEEGFLDKSNTISFNSSAPKTRAYVSGDVANTDKLKEGDFGVVGYSNNALYLGANNKAAQQKHDGSNWIYANPGEIRYWPNNNMDFYAYFPFAATGDVFSTANNTSDPVMTITNETGNQDVLFASALDQARVDRVDLKFHHAFSKIGGINIQIQNEDVTVVVKKVELINTFTKGQVLVDKEGKASYETRTVENRAKEMTSPVTITKGNTYNVSETTYKKLVGNNDNAYIFATNGSVANFVTGTNTALWDGKKTALTGGNTLESLGQVCLKLTCKVSTPRTEGTYYHVGAADAYGFMYIPISGSKITSINPDTANKIALLAGKRYTYNIIMKDNVGFDKNGDAILLPIMFETTTMDGWEDVTVTITL